MREGNEDMTGKQKCEMLKQLRKALAEANGIIYLSAECTYIGNCRGYCEKCDAEARYLDSELNRLARAGKTIKVTDVAYQTFLKNIDTIKQESESFENSEFVEGEIIQSKDQERKPANFVDESEFTAGLIPIRRKDRKSEF